MLTLTEEQKKNLEVAMQINRATRANPQSAYAGKYIGVWKQQVIAVADTLDELDAQLDALQADPNECIWIEASADYDEPEIIWGNL